MKDTLKEHCKKAGQVRSEKKRQAVIKNLEKAREAKLRETRAKVDRLRKITFPEEQ